MLRNRGLADLDAEFEQFTVDPGRSPEQGWLHSSAESNSELRALLMAVLIASASSKTGESLDGAVGRRWPA